MTEANAGTEFTYYGFCWTLDAAIAKATNVHYEHSNTFKGMAEMVRDIRDKREEKPWLTDVKVDSIQRDLASATERSINKRSLGYASFQLDHQILNIQGDLQPHLDVLFTECCPHIDLYRDAHSYFTYSEAFDRQVLAHRDALRTLAASPELEKSNPHKFDDVLRIFDLMAEAGPSDYWQLCIVCKAEN